MTTYELELTETQEAILRDLLKGIPVSVIAGERKCSVSNISQTKMAILKRYPKLERRIKQQNRKYRKVSIWVSDVGIASPDVT